MVQEKCKKNMKKRSSRMVGMNERRRENYKEKKEKKVKNVRKYEKNMNT